jgi:hypothetical protein
MTSFGDKLSAAILIKQAEAYLAASPEEFVETATEPSVLFDLAEGVGTLPWWAYLLSSGVGAAGGLAAGNIARYATGNPQLDVKPWVFGSAIAAPMNAALGRAVSHAIVAKREREAKKKLGLVLGEKELS